MGNSKKVEAENKIKIYKITRELIKQGAVYYTMTKIRRHFWHELNKHKTNLYSFSFYSFNLRGHLRIKIGLILC